MDWLDRQAAQVEAAPRTDIRYRDGILFNGLKPKTIRISICGWLKPTANPPPNRNRGHKI